jgi:hypothetical protein
VARPHSPMAIHPMVPPDTLGVPAHPAAITGRS